MKSDKQIKARLKYVDKKFREIEKGLAKLAKEINQLFAEED